MILFIASCGGMEASYGGNPNLDGVTFDYLSSFVYKGSEYQVSFPVNVENAEFYIYEETEYKTEVKNWTINYYYDAKYLYDEIEFCKMMHQIRPQEWERDFPLKK